jgi:hypothetical protein
VARSYYWSVMAEAMLEYRGDADQALLCLRKAAQYNASSPDWRILATRVLLRSALPILTSSGAEAEGDVEEGGGAAYQGEAPEAKTVLLEPLQVTQDHLERNFMLVIVIRCFLLLF